MRLARRVLVHGGDRTTRICWHTQVQDAAAESGRDFTRFTMLRIPPGFYKPVVRSVFGSSCDSNKHPPSQHECYLCPNSSFGPFYLRLSANCDSTLAELPRSPRGNATRVTVHLPSLITLNMPRKSPTLCIFLSMNLYYVSAFVKCQEQEKKKKRGKKHSVI